MNDRQPRLPLVAEPSPEARALLGDRLDGAGWPLNVLGVVAHHPLLLRRFVQLGVSLLHRGRIPARQREIVILRVAWRCGSLYEYGHHAISGREAGLRADEVAALTLPVTTGWQMPDRALIAMVDELHGDDRVTDLTWRELRTCYTEADMVELLFLSGFYRLVAGLVNSGDVQLEPGVPGWPVLPAGE